MEGFDRLWDEFSFELLGLTPAGKDTVLATGPRPRPRQGVSDHEFELTIHHVWRFRDGQVARMDAFLDPLRGGRRRRPRRPARGTSCR